jgi:carboxylesterase
VVSTQFQSLRFLSRRAEFSESVSPSVLNNELHLPPEVAVLVIHGIAGVPQNLSDVIEELHRKWQRRITFSAPLLPGHGTHPDDLRNITWNHWVNAGLISYDGLVELGAKKIVVVGYSMGAEVASIIVARKDYDPRLVGLVLINGPHEVQNFFAPLVSAPLVNRAVKGFYPKVSIIGTPADKDDPSNFSYEWVPSDTIDELNQMRGEGRRARSRINPKVRGQVIQGDADKTVNPDGALEMFKHLNCTNKDLAVIGGADHYFSYEGHRQRLMLVTTRFLEDTIGTN